jgi:hypothetical protein
MTKCHTAKSSVVDRHRFDTDPDPDPTLSFAHGGKSDLFLFLFTSVPVYATLFYLSLQRHRRHNFKYIGQYTRIFWLKV